MKKYEMVKEPQSWLNGLKGVVTVGDEVIIFDAIPKSRARIKGAVTVGDEVVIGDGIPKSLTGTKS